MQSGRVVTILDPKDDQSKAGFSCSSRQNARRSSRHGNKPLEARLDKEKYDELIANIKDRLEVVQQAKP